jgi:hypothetical protein
MLLLLQGHPLADLPNVGRALHLRVAKVARPRLRPDLLRSSPMKQTPLARQWLQVTGWMLVGILTRARFTVRKIVLVGEQILAPQGSFLPKSPQRAFTCNHKTTGSYRIKDADFRNMDATKPYGSSRLMLSSRLQQARLDVSEPPEMIGTTIELRLDRQKS